MGQNAGASSMEANTVGSICHLGIYRDSQQIPQAIYQFQKKKPKINPDSQQIPQAI
jgi:hypothetical protein